MTDQTFDIGELNDQELAEQILALTVLKDAVVEELDKRRARIPSWHVGTKHTTTLPNPDNPNKPIKVGEVRCDGGAVTARIKDRTIWEEWVAKNSPHNLVVQPPMQVRWVLDNASAEAVSEAWTAAQAVGDPNDPWSAPDALSRAQAFLTELEQRGYTLAESSWKDGKQVVMPNYEQDVLKLSKEAGTPVTQTGEIPEGIEVETAPGKPYVTVVKDDGVRLSFLTDLFARGLVPQVAGVTPTPTREES